MSSPRQKKVRGWRRRIEQLDAWAASQASLEIVPPAPWDYASAEFWFESWRKPLPLFAQRRVVQHLVDIHDAWMERLSRFDTRGLYVGIWLFTPALSESQVVVAGADRASDYRKRHESSKRSSPPPEYQGRPYDLSRFEWTHNVWRHKDSLLEYSEADHREVLRSAVEVETIDGETYVTFEHEDWYAMLPGR